MKKFKPLKSKNGRTTLMCESYLASLNLHKEYQKSGWFSSNSRFCRSRIHSISVDQQNRNLSSMKKTENENLIVDSANFIQIGLASSDEIQNWAERSSFLDQQFHEIGEVKRPDTLNYRTFKPEKDGLFCERIFGPVNDWICSCGQLKEQRFALDHEKALNGKLRPKICPNCQVEVTTSRLRRYRMGFISLACPVTHVWYLNSRPSLFSILLKMPTKYIKKIAYYKAYSPSLAYPEYLSAVLSPGGDFFDNEWEYIHAWLAGKHSSEDIPSPWGVKSFDVFGAFDKVQTAENLRIHLQIAGKPGSRDFGFDKSVTSGNQDTRFPSARLNSESGVLTNKMPESPNWLLNTGAAGLLNQLQSKDWEKEILRLEAELSSFHSPLTLPFSTDSSVLGSISVSTPSKTSSLEKIDDFNVLDVFGKAKTAETLNSSDSTQLRFNEKEAEFLLKRRKTRVRRLKLLKTFQKSGLSFSGMIFSSLPVLPPELRPIIQLGVGQLASSDVNDLYRRILSRNNRLKYYLYETHFVEFLVRSEQQLVQLAVDALLENGKTTQVRHTSGQKRLYKSLSDRIGGKQGRFRMNLLGKRVDYSGRSVIVVGPKLHLSQCGLPYEMAIELFQPFLLRHMLELQLAKTIRSAKNILRFNKPLARQFLHRVVQAHPILLNRAPTLHRLGIQAFQPLLVFGRAIHLHPLVCPAFNADFDGDQMAVHIPLSPQARIEARLLMLASGNWLSSSTGQPNLLPSQDMVLGFYYVTLEKYGYQKGRGLFFNHLNDVLQAYQTGELDLHSQIWVKTKINKAMHFTNFVDDGFNEVENRDPRKKTLRFLSQRNQQKIGLTADSLGRLTSPTKHKDRKNLQAPILHNFGQSPARQSEKSNSANLKSSIRQNFNELGKRFHRDVNQPIEIRLNQNGMTSKIYASYQWKEDQSKKTILSYIRTTPGRILLNQIMQKYF